MGGTLLLGILSGAADGAAVVNARAVLLVEPARVVATFQSVALPTATLIEE